MTPLQEVYLNRIKATASANMEFFRKNLPRLYDRLAEEGPSAYVDISDQGDLTVKYADGTSLNVAEHFEHMESSLRQFADIEARPQIIGFHAIRTIQEGEPGHGAMQRYHYTNLDADFPNRVKQHFVEHYPGQDGLMKYPECGTHNIPILIVVGSGFGWHLKRLLMEYSIKHMIIVETDIDAFRLSTFFEDYVQLSRLAIERGTSLGFAVEDEVDQITRTIVSLVQVSLPPCFIHGAGIFYATSDMEVVEQLKKALPIALWRLFFGLGYFDDELISLCHSFGNVRNGVPIYGKPGVVDEDAVAFVIGAGPSLDRLVPLLKSFRDRAVLFSCGTALSALEHVDVIPDFHFEKERPFLIHEVLTETVGEDFLKQIHFIGANVIYPPVFSLFKSAGMVLKSTDVFADLLRQQGEEVVVDIQPTVTNMALNMAMSLGFKKVYLVGVDFGYADTKQHHSKNTIYLDKMPKDGPVHRLFSGNRKQEEIVVEGNFGGNVFTSNILNAARLNMEGSVAAHPDVQVFNLNQGAKIAGTIPLQVEAFVCESRPEEKSGVVSAIQGAFVARELDERSLGEKLLQQIDAFIAEVSVLLDQPLTTKEDALQKMEEIYKFIFSVRLVSKPMNALFRGSLLQIMSYSYQMLSMIADEGEAAAKVQTDFGTMLDLLHKARAETDRILNESPNFP